MKRLLWFGGKRPDTMDKKEYQSGIIALAKACGGELVIFTKSTPDTEATFMIIGNEAAEVKYNEIKRLGQLKKELETEY